MKKLSSYTIDRDYGFAPNPFWEYCTLATCKPNIRGHANVGDFIIGFGGKRTKKTNKLIFLMQVEEVMTFNQYWEDERFQIKKPNIFGSLKTQYGDNIYHKDSKQNWIQINSHHSTEQSTTNYNNLNNDTKYDRVLISKNEWWYFGDKAVELPLNLQKFIHKRNHKNFVIEEDFSTLIEWVNKNYPTKGRLGLPNEWIPIKREGDFTDYE